MSEGSLRYFLNPFPFFPSLIIIKIPLHFIVHRRIVRDLPFKENGEVNYDGHGPIKVGVPTLPFRSASSSSAAPSSSGSTGEMTKIAIVQDVHINHLQHDVSNPKFYPPADFLRL